MRITDYKLQIAKLGMVILAAVMVSGCGMTIRGKGGVTKTTLPGVSAQANQPENPKDATTQDVNSETEESYTVPAGSTIEEVGVAKVGGEGERSTSNVQRSTSNSQGQETAGTVKRITVAEPMLVTKHTKHSAATTVGAAQVDTVGKVVATLKSVRWIQVVGILFIGFGIFSLAWPPLKLIINSVTTSALCIGAGAFLLFVTPVVAVHPVLCFSIAAGVCGLWYFAHRHGGVTAELSTVKDWLASELGGGTTVAPVPAAVPSIPAAPVVPVAPVVSTLGQ